MIPFGAFRPDQPKGARGHKNVAAIPDDQVGIAYAPTAQLSVLPSSGVLPAAPRGGLSAVTRAGLYKAYIGTQTNLYEVQNDGTFLSVASGFAVPDGDNWSMCQFGDYLLYTNRTDGMWAYNIETGANAAVTAAQKPRIIFVAFDAVFGLDCLDDTGNRDNRLIRSSAINDYTKWLGSGAQYQPLPDGEELLGGGEVANGIGLIIGRNAVRYMQRTGDKYVFTLGKMVTGEGAVNPQCIVQTDGSLYLVDTDGFKRATPGGLERIGKGRVDKTFLGQGGSAATSLNRVGSLSSIEGAFDPAGSRILWRYQRLGGPTGVFTDIIAYHFDLGEFVPLEQATMAILTMASPGYTSDNADSLGYADDPGMPGPDSRFWFGGEPRLAGIDADGKFGYFEGNALAATLETPPSLSGQSALFTSITPVVRGGNGTVRLGYAEKMSDALAYSASGAIQRSGRAPVRARGKVITAEVSFPAADSWEWAQGVDFPENSVGGNR